MLRKHDEPQLGAIYVDFIEGSNAHRRKFGGGRRQSIAKAVGLKKGAPLNILDATAGLGHDAFVLAALGCRVHMIERSGVIAKLLEDGLRRARLDSKIGPWVTERLSSAHQDGCKGFSSLPFKPDVVYLDPMFPEKKKSALVKKEMRMFQQLIGFDSDTDALLKTALITARNRVVVKRPAHSGWLTNQPPNTSIKTKKIRFDIYLI